MFLTVKVTVPPLTLVVAAPILNSFSVTPTLPVCRLANAIPEPTAASTTTTASARLIGLPPLARLQVPKTILERDGRSGAGRPVQRLERAGLRDRVCPPEQEIRLAPDRGAHVLELEPVGVRGSECDPLGPALAPELDHGRPAVPWGVEEER